LTGAILERIPIIGKLFGKDKSYIDFKRQERLAIQQSENQNPGTDEYTELTNRAGYLITDQISMNVLLENRNLNSLVPVLSPTNSVIKLSKQQADLKRIRIDNHIALLKLCMDPDVYEANGLEILEGYRMYGHDRVSGAEEGWIGHIATETTRVHRFEEKKKGE
jgi:hypothetical protein